MPDLHLRLNDASEGDGPAPKPIDAATAIPLLERAEISGETLVPWGSNYTFAVALCEPESDAVTQFGIYKPVRGERPLWDFPGNTLYRRERASWLLADLLGWQVVPPTVIREGPYGIGSLQLYVEPAGEMHEDDQLEFWRREMPEIERLVLFDILANNADRKLTHCLVDTHGHLWGIDHGLTFNAVPKLRTVLWQFVGKPVSPELMADIVRVRLDERAL
ncbi:MAG TPA: SCO1664 family protein, partial [Thermomicrobiales bacterium]|nr:SCO1664 family protein [Thermomicrobiales bacterium]